MTKYIDALNKISPNLSRDEWVKTAMAAKSAGIDFNHWNSWSSHGETYNERDAKAVWQSADATGGITGGTLLHMAGYESKKNGAIQGARNDHSRPGNTQPLDTFKRPAKEVMALFTSYPDATESHHYIVKKQGWADDLKVVPDNSKEMIRGVSLAGALVIPCIDGDNINTLQYITQNEKLNLANASFGDGYFMQGHDKQKIYVTEGIGQLWAAIEATGFSAVSTFGVSRTKKVISKLKQRYPDSEIIICADAGQEAVIEQIARESQAKAVFMPNGWDKNSDLNDLMIKDGIAALKQLLNKPITPTDNKTPENDFNLDCFALNGKSQEMRSKMLEDKYVAGKLAILGQVTFWYARPNCGKTLLIIWLLIDAIKRGEIKAEDIYHMNADDNHKGLTYKLEIAEQWGFKSISPGYNGFKAELLPNYIDAMIKSGTARGKVIILDTVKKFADIMDKKRGSRFGEVVRQFSMHGGTVIGLAHVNKHADDDGNVVYAGTTDLVDDCDCAYTLETVTEDQSSGIRTVKFTNIKNRGDVALEALYEYDYSEKLNYQSRLNSVRSLSDEEKQQAINRKYREAALERNRDAIEVIKNLIKAGTTNKTDIIKAAQAEGITKAKSQKALKEHEGKSVIDHQYWQVSIQANNAHVYKLNIFA